MYPGVCQLSPPDDTSDEDDLTSRRPEGFPTDSEELPYKVEVWDEAGQFVDQVVAVSISAAIGYAAYYAATREYPGRGITLRHKGRVISRWTSSTH
jgi:hypothetical protein